MGRKEDIRNIGIIAHIDHGKTTMTDSLLAEAGLLSPKIAGEARALDYLEEEQKRGITIKTANISLLHEIEGRPYVINLIDTPGHVDFTGKVTRALRAIDGCVVVVDAVEEVMVQTETVTRQALNERVRPVLFINKVDRLIRELKLSPEETQKKLARIIRDFNNLIELYGEPEFKDKWKVDPAKGTVAFGSALHRWGFTVDIAQKKGVKFKDVVDAYEKGGLALTLSQVGFVYGTVGWIALSLGGILGGFAVAKQGLKFWIWWMLIAINLPDAVYIFLAYTQTSNLLLINTCIAIEQFGYGFGFAAFLTRPATG